MAGLILYTRPDCHLCDEAMAVLEQAAPGTEYQAVDIEPELRLIQRYGLRVPVLKRTDTGAELDWPFGAAGLSAFLR